VPDEGVPVNGNAALLRVINQRVGHLEGPLAFLRLHGFRLHAVFRRELVELTLEEFALGRGVILRHGAAERDTDEEISAMRFGERRSTRGSDESEK